MQVKYITFEHTFENVDLINCSSLEELEEKQSNKDDILINNKGRIEQINANYIRYFQL